MCPICWATALATFGMLLVVSIVIIVGTDKSALVLAAMLGAVSVAHRWEVVTIPWWFIAVFIAAPSARVAYLAQRHGLLLNGAWNRARKVASRRCPTKQMPVVPSDTQSP